MNSRYKFFFPVIFTLFFVVFCFPLTSTAQKSDKAGIEQAIENYIVGWRTADKELLEAAFDMEAGVVLWVDRKGEEEKLKSMTLAELASSVKVQEGYGIGYTVQNLDIIDAQLAIATVKIPIKESYYIDGLELQKINGKWKIILKSFVYFPKE